MTRIRTQKCHLESFKFDNKQELYNMSTTAIFTEETSQQTLKEAEMTNCTLLACP